MYFSKLLSRALAFTAAVILVSACGGGGGGGAPAAPAATVAPIPLQNNELGIVVDAGPAGTGYNVNRLYTTVKICQPGTSLCQTIDHVLVDTGSTGLRLLSSAISSLSLSRVIGDTGFPLLNCAQFVDNTFAWGPVATADIVLGSKTASSVPIQIIADPVFNSHAAACSASGTALSTASNLGANGILGLGLNKEDCGSGCTGNTANGFYYTCTAASCAATTGATASIAKQLTNPVPLFGADNNGIVINLPAVNLPGVTSLSGSLIFGINTQSNNQFTTGAVLATNATGKITTTLLGSNLRNSFIDTGSNGLFFYSTTIPSCSTNPDWFCPVPSTSLTAILAGVNSVTRSVSFTIDNAVTLFGTGTNNVLPNLAGKHADSTMFDWGLPFFYGRQVFIGIEGQSSPLGTGPYYAF